MAGYSEKAQPFLDAIAGTFFADEDFRNWMIEGTPAALAYLNASPLYDEQRDVRWHSKQTKQPFWANYWCGFDQRCSCRPSGSTALEADAIFFLRNGEGRTLGIHVEFKHLKERFSLGQAQAYGMRAACFVKTHQKRAAINRHEDWVTVLFCSDEEAKSIDATFFQRVIPHTMSALKVRGWPQ